MTETIACPYCRATFPLERATPVVSCPYCRHSFQSHALAHAQAHANQYAAHQQQAEGHARWAEIHASKGQPTTPWAALLTFPFMGIIGLAVASAIGGAQLISEDAWLYGCVGFGIITTVGLMTVSLLHGHRVSTSDQTLVTGQRVGVSCPQCGAPATLVHGQAVGTCAYCNAALVPGSALMAAAIDEAKMQQRYELFRSAREERRGDARVEKMGRDHTWVSLPISLVISGICLAVFDRNITTALITWSGVVGISAVLGIRYAVQRTRRAALCGVFHDMALQLRGEVLDFARAVHWLDAFWPSSLMQAFWWRDHPSFAALATTIYGYPCYLQLLPVNHFPLGGYAVVNVACAFADRYPAITPAAKATKRWLKERRFKLTIEEGGLSVVRDLTKHPAYWKEPASAHELATIATRLAQTAHELGGQTVPPMPA